MLSAFAIAQPLYDILARHPEFFVAHRSQVPDILITAAALSLLLPLLLAAPVLLLDRYAPRAGQAARAGLVFVLSSLLCAGFLSYYGFIPAPIMTGMALAAGFGFTRFAYGRKPVTMLLTWASPAVLIFPLFFLFFTPVKKLLTPLPQATGIAAKNNHTPVVMLVFDELPLVSLLDRDGGIDRHRYPNFHALSRESLWFRNATTVAEHTMDAVPALLTGRYPDRKRIADYIDHPVNLFTLLSASHDLSNVNELMTSLCPASLCWNRKHLELDFTTRIAYLLGDLSVVYLHLVLPDQYRAALPPIHHAWDGFLRRPPARPPARAKARNPLPASHPLRNVAGGTPAWFVNFLDRLEDGGKPGLHFSHVMLPHYPWVHLPDGRRYSGAPKHIPGLINNHTWGDAQAPALAAQQRHLLQLGLVDGMVGALLERLHSAGLYDKSLLIVTADHGTSFLPGTPRRHVNQANAGEVLYVPLFIKPPHSRSGENIAHPVELVDVMPTIADVLELQDGPAFAGQGLQRRGDGRAKKLLFTQKHERMEFAADISLDTALRRKIEHFGDGDDRYGLFRPGAAGKWVGMPLAGFEIPRPAAYEVRLDQKGLLNKVDASSNELPAFISGRLRASGDGGTRVTDPDVLFAINGVIGASAPSYSDDGGAWYRFSAILPPHLLRDGYNELRILVPHAPRGRTPRLYSSVEK